MPLLKNIALIKEVVRNANEIRDQIIVLKLPAVIIQNTQLLTNFADIIQILDLCGAKVFIIHDHINLESEILNSWGINEDIANVIRASSGRPSSQIMEMILSGYVNKRIVSALCDVGCGAIGISCKDTNLIQARKSKLSNTNRGVVNQTIIDIGFINEPIIINPDILLNFENNNIVSVISPVANDENGNTQILDVNLTMVAISSVLGADHLIFPCTEPSLSDQILKVGDIEVLKSMLNRNQFVKKDLLEAAVIAIENNTDSIHFVDATSPDLILLSMLADDPTVI